MDGLQPSGFSTNNPQINFQFHLVSNGNQTAGYIFKSWQNDQFQPQNPSSALVAFDVAVTRSSVDEIPGRVDDAEVRVGDSISTWGIATKNPFKLQLNGLSFFEGWVEAANGIPSAQLNGTWTRTF